MTHAIEVRTEPKSAPRKSRKARPRGGIIRIRGKTGETFKVKIDIPGVAGAPGRRHTVTRTFKTRDEAEAELKRLREQAKRRIRVVETQTLNEWAEQWLADLAADQAVSVRTHERYGELLRHHVIPALGDYPLRTIQTADIEGLYRSLAQSGRRRASPGAAGKGLSAQTITHVHRVLSQCLKDAVRLKCMWDNPAAMVKRKRNRKTVAEAGDGTTAAKMKILDREQLAALLAGFKGFGSTFKNAPYPLVLLALDSGARRGELLALRWCDIDLDRRTVRIVRAVDVTEAAGVTIKDCPKNESSVRRIAISTETANVLRELQGQDAVVQESMGRQLPADALAFPRDAEHLTAPLCPQGVTKAFSRGAAKLGFRGLRFHDLRHNCASHMLKAGRPIPDVARHMGHSSLDMVTRVYGHAIPSKDVGLGLLDELAGPRP